MDSVSGPPAINLAINTPDQRWGFDIGRHPRVPSHCPIVSTVLIVMFNSEV